MLQQMVDDQRTVLERDQTVTVQKGDLLSSLSMQSQGYPEQKSQVNFDFKITLIVHPVQHHLACFEFENQV